MREQKRRKTRIIKDEPCAVCRDIPNWCSALWKLGEALAELPPAVGKLETFSDERGNSWLKRCPGCGAVFRFTSSYEFLANGSEDELTVERLRDPVVVLEQLQHFKGSGSQARYRNALAFYTEEADQFVRKLLQQVEQPAIAEKLRRYRAYAAHLAGKEIDLDDIVPVLEDAFRIAAPAPTQTHGCLVEDVVSISFNEVEAAYRTGGIDGLAREVRAKLGRATADLVVAAVSVDRAFLDRYPEALFQVIYNRCYWVDPPEPDRYYRFSPGIHVTPRESTRPRLSDQVEVWRKQVEDRAATTWLRACKPLPTKLVLPAKQNASKASVRRSKRRIEADWHARSLEVVDEKGRSLLRIRSTKWNPERDAILSRNGRLLATVHDGKKDRVHVWNVDKRSIAHALYFPRSYSEASLRGFSPNSKFLLTSHNNGLGTELFRAWDIERREVVWSLAERDYHDIATAFSPDSRRIAIADSVDGLRVYDIESGIRVCCLHGVRLGYGSSIRFSPDGNAVMTGRGRAQKKWDLDPEAHRMPRGHREPVLDVQTNQEETLISSRSSDEVFVWDPVSGQPLLVLHTLAGAARFFANGCEMITQYGDGEEGFASRWAIDSGMIVAREPARRQRIVETNRPTSAYVLQNQGAYAALCTAGREAAMAHLPHRIERSVFAGKVCAITTDAGEFVMYEVRESAG